MHPFWPLVPLLLQNDPVGASEPDWSSNKGDQGETLGYQLIRPITNTVMLLNVKYIWIQHPESSYFCLALSSRWSGWSAFKWGYNTNYFLASFFRAKSCWEHIRYVYNFIISHFGCLARFQIHPVAQNHKVFNPQDLRMAQNLCPQLPRKSALPKKHGRVVSSTAHSIVVVRFEHSGTPYHDSIPLRGRTKHPTRSESEIS